jgi:hypothetical protein
MPDLNLTESEKRIFTDSEAPKTIKPFAEWSGENESPSDDPQSFLNYADFVRNELGDSYDARSEQDIQVGLRQGLSLVEGMTEESIEQSLAPKESDFDTKLNVVFSSLGVKDPDRLVLLDYQSGAQVLSEQPDVAEEYRLKVDSMREQAEVVVNNRLDQTKEELVYSNQLPFAFVQAEGGSRKLLVSDIASKMPLQKAIKASQLGGVSFNPEDVSLIQSNLQVIPDTGVTIYKTKELMEISKGIIELSKNDEYVADFVDGASLQMAREKDTTAESVSRSFGDNVSEFLGAIGVADAEIDEKRERVRYASGRDVDDAVEYITDQLNESGASYKPSDVRDAYESLVVQNGFSKGVFTLRSEGKEVSENVINTKLGAQINPAVFVNDELFEKSILAHPELSAETKKLFVSSRKLVLDDQFDNYSKVLDDSSYADEWSEALLRGRQAGKEDAKILTEFTADKEVFSELGARTSGIAASVWDSVASLVYLAPTVLGSDWGKEGLQNIAKDQSNRRQIAQMFGANFGVGQDIMEAIAPMIVDIGATYLLSTATAGAGGAAYLSAKSGARLTTSGMIKGITSNVLRASDDALESVAKTALARDLIRGNLGDATEAIRAYNNVVAQKMGIAVGLFVPAASRISATNYGSMYNQLKASNPDMSDDELHDRALGFAMTTGVAGGLITSAFSAIGRGGVEDALLKGMNFREAKSVLGALANTGGITDESLKSAMGQVLRDSLKKHSGQFLKTGRKIAKNGIDESLEEGIDQLVNSYIEDVGLDQSTPLAEKWNQTVHAAMVGGVLGAGVPAIQAGASRVGVTPTDRLAQNFKLREQYIQDVAANLKESGSPITAEVVSQVINQRKRTMPTPPPAAPPTEPVVDEKAQTQISFDTAKQELTALQQEQEQLDSIGEPDEAQVVRIGELNALVAEKENEVIVFTDTLRSLAAQDGEFIAEAPKKELDLLKELEGVSPEEVKYRVERLRNKNSAGKAAEIPESKSYARRVSRDKIQFDTAPSTSENALIIQRKATDLAGMGYPQQITYKEDFDLPIYNDADAAAFSDYVASVAYTIYPTVKVKEPYGGSVFQSPTKKESFDPTTGKRGVVTGFLDENGSGVFDNNPVVVAEMLRANVPVFVPKNFALSSLNPSIIVDPDNNVVDVVAPSSDSNVLESKVASLEQNRELYFNNVEASRLEAIPFKSVELPDGVARFDTANGATIEGNFQTVAQIKNSLNAFLSELQKTGDERNIEAHSRMVPLSNTEDTEAQLQAFIDAREKFVFNARMFELRGALQQDPTDKVGKFLSRVNLKKEAAAKRVLPLISIDKAGDLSNDEIIEIFVDQYAVNNTALSGNTPPSFASVLSDSTRNFAVQKDYIDNRHRADANATLPVDEGDITDIARKQSDFIDNFGRKPDGEVAAPEDVAAMMVASIDKAIEAINSDQKLRVTVEDFVSNNVFDGSLQMQEITRSLNPKDLFGFLSSWVVSSNGRVRSSMSDFVSTLESGDLFRGIDLRDALIATRFTTRPDGLGISNKSAVDEFQSLFADFTGELLTTAQARNTMLAIDGALRTRLSKAKITDNRRAEITEQNDAAIIKLGLKSGDPASVVKALKNVAKGMGNKNEQLVAKLLLEDTDFIQNNVRFVIGGGSIDIAGKYIKAINGNHIVFINRTSGSGRGLINTLLEEYVHAFTSDTVAATDTALSKNKGKASARLKLEKIFNSISRNYDAEVAAGSIPNSVVADGVENLDEFIAKFFLVDGFQKYVKDIVGPNAFDGIIDSIVTIFPKVTPSEKSSYVSAFKDVLDLGKRGRKQTAPDAKALGSSAADKVLFSAPISSSPTAAQDAEYLQAVESGDMDKAQRMVDDAAKAAGYGVGPVYHGGGFDITVDPVFKRSNKGDGVLVSDQGIFFSDRKSYADFMASNGGTVTTVFLRLDNPREFAPNEGIGEMDEKLLRSQGYDGWDSESGLEYVVFDPSQIKSADPVTYDESGNVIPLSQRFDETKSSILFSAPSMEATVDPNILEGVPEDQKGLVSQGINLIRSLLPPSIQIKAAEIDTGGSLAFVNEDESAISINRGVLANILASRDYDSLSAKNIIGVSVNEEIAHTAGFNALTQEEVDNYVESLSDGDYQKIITEYTQNSPESFAEELRAGLASEDADVVLRTKRQLAEEKLRMHLQKVTRGFTTEEDVRFWKSKPSLFAMLKRYLAGALRRFAANRKPLGGAGGAALNKMINEMRAIEVGFVRQPNSMSFDPENPEATYQMLRTANQDFFESESGVLSSSPIKGIKKKNSLRLRMTRKEIIEAVESSKDWKDFYDRHEALLKDYFGPDAELFQRILSATSQAASVKANVALALKAYGQMKRGEPFLDSKGKGKGYLKGVASNLEKIRDDEELSGRKISNYDKATAGDTSKVVVDRHVARMLFNKTSPSKAQFEKAEKVLTEVANTLGWQPREVQAALWGASIRKSGVTPVSYNGYLETLYERNDIERRIGSPLPRDGGYPILASAGISDTRRGDDSLAEGRRRSRPRSGRGGRAAETPLADAPTVGGISGGIPKLIQAAESYAKRVGIPHRRQSEFVTIDKDFSERLAKAYDEMDHDPKNAEVAEAYSELIRQVRDQYDELVSYGYEFWFIDPDKDPYEGKPWRAMADLRNNDSMGVFPTAAGFGTLTEISDNPLENTDTGLEWSYGSPDGPKKPVLANDLFRAVHDALGHGLEGSGFRARGEENAWQAHSRLFYGSAIAAMTSETRGQNYWLNFGPYGKKNQKALIEDTTFADQKTGLLPSWAWEERVALDEPTALFSAPVSGISGDYAPIVDLLEVPKVEIDRFGKPKNSIIGFVDKVLSGEVSEPFRRLIENRKFFKTAVEDDVSKFKKTLDKIIIKTYGSFENAPMDMVATAQGFAFRSLISEERGEQIDDAYEAALDDIDARLAAEDIDTKTAKEERQQALALKEAQIDSAYEEGFQKAEEDRNEALRKISLDSPEMAAFIIDIRQRYIIPMQQKLKENGLDNDIALKISRTGEVYLTRAYRMFTDSTYLDNLKKDESYPAKRDAALAFFKKQFIRDHARKIREDLREDNVLITYQEAKQRAKRLLDRKNEMNPSSSYEQEALDAFLESYEPKAKKSLGSSDSGIKMAMDNLKQRKDLPKAIRDLLGEYGPETGTDLILRTYSTVANIAAQQTFLQRLKATAEKAGLMISVETKLADAEGGAKYANWEPVRPETFANKNDPLAGMLIHPDFREAMDMTLKNSYLQEYAATSERVINGAFTLASKLSGKAMAFKTLGSVGFYFRNAIGNFIFGSAQGFFRYDKMLAGMSKSSIDALLGRNGEVDPVVSELIGLGVMGDEIRAGVMRDLLNGKQTPDGIQKELENLMDKSQIRKPAKVLAAIEKKAQDLSAALDAAYKVVYFQHELAYIERSVAEGGESSLYGKMSPTQRKREAARKVLMTAQSYSQAPPIVTDFTKSPLGLMFAPFLRFKAEMFRIPFNTYKLGLEEIRSGDPVMRQRGMLRMASMTGVLGILSSALPMIMASVSGIGDEENEDEAIRESLPEYLRGHTFYYFYLGGKLKSFDATYLNPFAGTVDPILRSLEKIQQGKYSEAGAAFALGYIKDQFLDTQILANAAINAANNTDQSTGKPIWNRGVDEPIDVATKLFSYVASEAYAPRIGKDFVKGLETQSLSGMLGALGSGAAPARIYDVDLQRGFERFLLDHNKRFADVKSELGKLRSGQPMSDETIRETIDDNIEARRRMNYELMRVARGFSSLGLGADKVISTMHDRGIGKQRTKLLSYGFMDRPPINLIAESLLQERSKEFGPARLQKIVEYYQTKNRYIQVSPVTETD